MKAETSDISGVNDEVSLSELGCEVEGVVRGYLAYEAVRGSVIEAWCRCDGQDVGGECWRYPAGLDSALKQLIPRLGHKDLLESVGEAFRALPGARDNQMVRYFCGICWNKIKNKRVES